jgi:hypothetical protein
MRTSFRRIAMATLAVVTIGTATATLTGTAEARWHGGGWHGGGWHGGGWHGGWNRGWRRGGWGWGGFGWGFAPGFAIGFGAPFYGGGPYYAYGGDCVMRRRWVINRWGHRVLRWTRVCF